MKEQVTRTEAAKLLGISVSGIDNLVQRGALQRVGRGKFNRQDIEAYHANRDPDAQLGAKMGANRHRAPELTVIDGGANVPSALVSNKIRKEAALADKAEYELKLRRGELVDAAAVKKSAADVTRLLCTRLNAFSGRLGPMLAPITDTVECVQTIKDEVRIVIEEMRQGLNELGGDKPAK